MVADLQQVDEMDESEFHAEKLNAREVILHKLKICSQSQREQWMFIGGDQVLRTPPWQGFSQDRGEVQHDLLGESDGFPSTTKARNRRASPQSIQWSAKTSPTAKNYVEKFFDNIGHEVPQQADVTTSITGENSRQINKSANTCWKVHGSTGKSVAKVNSTLLCFFFFSKNWRHVAERKLIRTVDNFSMSPSPSTFDSPGTLGHHLQLWTVRLRRRARRYTKILVEKIGSSGKLDERRRNSNHDAASSSSQGLQKDALLDGCTFKLVATMKPRGLKCGQQVYTRLSRAGDLQDVHRHFFCCTVFFVFLCYMIFRLQTLEIPCNRRVV